MLERPIKPGRSAAIYTREQRLRRDASPWTIVQAILAPIQFLVFLVSVGLVAYYLVTGAGLALATASVVLKTFCLYAIMVTGAIWEKEVFGQHLFAPAFFWEDAVSMIVIALHTAYLVMLLGRIGSPETQLWVALAGYAVYVINAGQFIWKLQLARREPASGRETAS
ncbi:2-vinyl bacteriochlorophyllide hydratase [Hyphomonas sp.]|uniref:2-vinyl bacteriochlorophyllide hydratase n=1 Tax=Hyphomonas sp. TaxID=87 RepID=UPI001BD121C2|nr:2-vinyl bacteriochlorophyllide hydratase [Hyphomonas sp.]